MAIAAIEPPRKGARCICGRAWLSTGDGWLCVTIRDAAFTLDAWGNRECVGTGADR